MANHKDSVRFREFDVDPGIKNNCLVTKEQTAYLVLCRDGRKIEVHKEEFFIGRLPENDLVLTNSVISGKHCIIFVKDNNYIFQDLNSFNGSFINGKTVETENSVYLHDGDRIRLANVELLFRIEYIQENLKKKTHTANRIISICSVEGGCGKTLLALSLAHSLSRHGYRVCYINAESVNTFQAYLNGDICDHYRMIENLERNESLNYSSLEKSLIETEFGFWCVPAIFGSLEMNGINQEAYIGLIKLIKIGNSFDFLIVDSDSQINDVKMEIMTLSDFVLLIQSDRRGADYKRKSLESIIDASGRKFVRVMNSFDGYQGFEKDSVAVEVQNLNLFPRIENSGVDDLFRYLGI